MFKFKFLLLFVFNLFILSLFAQNIDLHQIVNKPYAERFKALSKYENYLSKLSPKEVNNAILSGIALAKKNKDEKLLLHLKILQVRYNGDYAEHPKKELIKFNKINEIAKRLDYPIIQILTLVKTTDLNWNYLKDYQAGFIDYIKLHNQLKKVDYLSYPDKIRELSVIGEAFYLFKKYDYAIKYLEEASLIPETEYNSLAKANALNSLGLCYRDSKRAEKAIHYFKKVLNLKYPNTVKIWKPIVSGNIGASYYRLGKEKEAIPYMKIDLQDAINKKDTQRFTGTLLVIGNLNAALGRYDSALVYYDKAKVFLYRMDRVQYIRHYKYFFSAMAHYYKCRKMYVKALAYKDSMLNATNITHQIYDPTKIVIAEQKIEIQKDKLAITELKLIHQRKVNFIIIIIIILITVVATLFILYLISLKKSLKKTIRLNENKLSLEDSNQKYKDALKRLIEYSNQIAEKNKEIEDMKGDKNQADQSESINKLKEISILTEDDWKKFQVLFDAAFPGFIYKLKTKYPQLSPALIRFLLLSKLQFCNKEMASILGVSVNSIQVTRHRLVTKLNLKGEFPINNLLENI